MVPGFIATRGAALKRWSRPKAPISGRRKMPASLMREG